MIRQSSIFSNTFANTNANTPNNTNGNNGNSESNMPGTGLIIHCNYFIINNYYSIFMMDSVTALSLLLLIGSQNECHYFHGSLVLSRTQV